MHSNLLLATLVLLLVEHFWYIHMRMYIHIFRLCMYVCTYMFASNYVGDKLHLVIRMQILGLKQVFNYSNIRTNNCFTTSTIKIILRLFILNQKNAIHFMPQYICTHVIDIKYNAHVCTPT